MGGYWAVVRFCDVKALSSVYKGRETQREREREDLIDILSKIFSHVASVPPATDLKNTMRPVKRKKKKRLM